MKEVNVRLKIAESQLNGINKTWTKCDIEPRDMKSGGIKHIKFDHEIIKKPSMGLRNYAIMELSVNNMTNVGMSVNNKVFENSHFTSSKRWDILFCCMFTLLHVQWFLLVENPCLYIVTLIVIG